MLTPGEYDLVCRVPHRALGRNEECGLRCLYHGWKFDVEGNVLVMASEPQGTRMNEKIRHKAWSNYTGLAPSMIAAIRQGSFPRTTQS